jgi:hypothetical protein
MARRFTLAEAQSLVPLMDRLLREALTLKTDFDEAERAIQAFTERIMMMGGVAVDRDRALANRQRREVLGAALRRTLEQIQETGCLVKDLDIGLVDFPTTFRGIEVYLCWKLGETSIEFWHRVEEGFRGRKAIDQDFLDHHEGGESED